MVYTETETEAEIINWITTENFYINVSPFHTTVYMKIRAKNVDPWEKPAIIMVIIVQRMCYNSTTYVLSISKGL